MTIAERHERKKYVELLEEEEIEENEEENNPVQDSIPAVPIVMENDDSLDVPSTNNVVLEDVNNNQINNAPYGGFYPPYPVVPIYPAPYCPNCPNQPTYTTSNNYYY